jgi:hypothetical protein
LDVSKGQKGDAYCWYDQNNKEADPSNDHRSINEDVALQEKLVPEMADLQLLVAE